MIRRLLLGLMVTVALCGYLWNGSVALWFGRYDEASWQTEHASLPPVHTASGSPRALVVDTRRIVPSTGLAAPIKVQNANNNLHAIRHAGRVYLAWRTAPTHFSSEFTEIHVASSSDEITWRKEASFSLGTDLREPQLLSLHGRLYLYVSKLGKSAFDFEPAGVEVATRSENGVWSGLSELQLPGHIAWSVRSQGSFAVMAAYTGGENLYALFPDALRVRLLSSQDGTTWQPWKPLADPFYEGGASETDFVTTKSGGFLTVMRNEGGDDTGYGSLVCERVTAGMSGQTACRPDAKKFDSPRLFRVRDQTYLFARRNVTEAGVFDQPSGLLNTGLLRGIVNQLKYIVERKRCSLWRYIEEERRFAFELDLPSRGDTCFASVIETSEPSEIVVYNYSSDVNGPDVPWTVGQRAPTYIYRHVVRFEAAE